MMVISMREAPIDRSAIARAATVLRKGGVVAFPTDTFYGLAADPRSDAPVSRIYEIKGRPPASAMPLIAASREQAGQAAIVDAISDRLAAAFWPGPLTLVVPALQTLYGTWDAADGHYRRYGLRRLRALLGSAGFTVDSLRYVNLPGMLPWFLNGRVLRRPYAPGAAFRLYDQLVPLIRLLEDRWCPPLGQSLVAIARRD